MPGTVLFVYGTLMRGQPAHGLLAGQTFLGGAVTAPGHRLIDLGSYPGLIEVAGSDSAVYGEVWEVDDARLAELDDYEGAPDLFARRPITIRDRAGPAEAYFYNRPLPPACRGGSRWPFS